MALKENFIAVPIRIILDNRCTSKECLVLGYINTVLSNNPKFYASNKHIAEYFNCSTKTISKSINNLLKNGYISIRYENQKRIIKQIENNVKST